MSTEHGGPINMTPVYTHTHTSKRAQLQVAYVTEQSRGDQKTTGPEPGEDPGRCTENILIYVQWG